MEFPVPGPVPFESAMLKVDRAKRHVNDLQARLTAFLQSDFYRLRVDKDTESGGYVVMYNTNPLPSDCALILGDAIHNLATPFDHIASELAVRIGLSGNKRREIGRAVQQECRSSLNTEAGTTLRTLNCSEK